MGLRLSPQFSAGVIECYKCLFFYNQGLTMLPRLVLKHWVSSSHRAGHETQDLLCAGHTQLLPFNDLSQPCTLSFMERNPFWSRVLSHGPQRIQPCEIGPQEKMIPSSIGSPGLNSQEHHKSRSKGCYEARERVVGIKTWMDHEPFTGSQTGIHVLYPALPPVAER